MIADSSDLPEIIAWEKTITFVVPCFNSAAYMDTCIESLLLLGDDIEIIIVDDGSTLDETPLKADIWAEEFPQTIKAIHKENGGHGSAVNAGLDAASGFYFKVVDSDDWLDLEATLPVMEYLRAQVHREAPTDLVVANYVYEKIHQGISKVMSARHIFPAEIEIGWDDMLHFGPFEYLHMHAVIYRTGLLRSIGLRLPEHCYYVDNVYVYTPLIHVRSIYYFDRDVYRYYIGREGQSVSVEAMYERIDQHVAVTKAMIDAVNLPDDSPSPKLYRMMTNHMAMMMCVAAIFLRMHDTFCDDRKLKDLWDYLHIHSPLLFRRVKRQWIVLGTNIPTRFGRMAALYGYKIVRSVFNFN